MNHTLKLIALLMIVSAILFSACKKDDDKVDANATLKSEIKENYANLVYQNYKDSYDAVVELRTAVNTFVTTPTQTNFDAAKQAWLDAREPYGQTEAFRFANGPIDDADGPEGLLNAWPLDEGYVDYVTANATSGIVNDTTVTIDAATLESLNEQGGETNIAIGYHAIEFLLWGQDNPTTSLETAGQRPYTDYLTTGGTAANQARRGAYLNVVADLLVDHLQLMVDAWSATGSNNYRATFLALDNDVALTNILTALGVLSKGELAGERIFVAYDNQDQEDEHSCFSDNTHRDIILNAKGIKNVYTGTYVGTSSTVSGSSLSDLAEIINPTLNQALLTLLNTSETNTTSIYVPFDHALTLPVERPQILTTVQGLQAQGDKIVEVAAALGLTISAELPE